MKVYAESKGVFLHEENDNSFSGNSLLSFLIKAKIQRHQGHNITFNEVMKILLSHYHQVYQVEEKE